MPTVGQELMPPPMDTGAIAIKITTDANLPIEQTQEVMEKINNLMYRKTSPKRDAMLESIKIRAQPVLMTAFAVSVGMLPVAQGTAIGLERLAPLVVGTLMTLIFIPIGFIWLVDEKTVVGEN